MFNSYLITGATGLIGRALVNYLLEIRRNTEGRIAKIYAAVRDIPRAKRFFGDEVEFVYYDALKEVRFNFHVDVIIHAASNASPNLFIDKPVETVLSNVFGIKELMDYARRNSVAKVVYVSSSEVYGKATPRINGFMEGDYGFVDVLDVRSSYPLGKRAAENLIVGYAAEYGVNASIARPGHIYGPTASPNDKRVSSAFAWHAAKGEPIILKSAGMSRRSYTHSYDCARGILTIADKGVPSEAYNIANREGVCTIRQMAEIMADEGQVEVKYECPEGKEKNAFNPMDNSCLDPARLESLGWKGEIGFEEGFRQTVRDIRKMICEGRA